MCRHFIRFETPYLAYTQANIIHAVQVLLWIAAYLRVILSTLFSGRTIQWIVLYNISTKSLFRTHKNDSLWLIKHFETGMTLEFILDILLESWSKLFRNLLKKKLKFPIFIKNKSRSVPSLARPAGLTHIASAAFSIPSVLDFHYFISKWITSSWILHGGFATCVPNKLLHKIIRRSDKMDVNGGCWIWYGYTHLRISRSSSFLFLHFYFSFCMRSLCVCVFCEVMFAFSNIVFVLKLLQYLCIYIIWIDMAWCGMWR